MKINFKRIAKFKFEDSFYQMFCTEKGKIAFLKVTEDEKYSFPTIEEFTNLVRLFSIDHTSKSYSFKNGSHRSYSFIPKIKHKVGNKVVLVAITSALIMSMLTGCNRGETYAKQYSFGLEEYENVNISSTSKPVEDDRFIENEDVDANLVTGTVRLYNNKYFNELFGCENVTPQEIIELIENKKLSPEYKEFIKNFVLTMDAYYKNLEYRVFAENIKGVKFDIRSRDDMCFIDGSVAKYDSETNTMILMEGMDLVNDPQAKIIFRHELGHMFNNLELSKDGYNIEYHFNVAGRGLYLSEALDVIFTTLPFLDEYPKEYEDSFGYQITSNIVRVLLDNINYDLETSITNNVYTFQDALGTSMPNDIDPEIIEELIELHWIEYDSCKIEVDADEYKDLYGYIARLFIANNITPNMSYTEIMDLKEELIIRLSTGVKNDAYVLSDAIETEFMNYIESNEIHNELKK